MKGNLTIFFFDLFSWRIQDVYSVEETMRARGLHLRRIGFRGCRCLTVNKTQYLKTIWKLFV